LPAIAFTIRKEIMNWKKIILWSVIALVVVFLGIQLVPYGRDHQNPPVTNEVTWNDPAARELAVAACYDCHSNETVWPWYSNIAPVSWLVQRDVEEGRQRLNFSEWPPRRLEPGEWGEVVYEGEMPPFYYTIMHRNAKLTDAEKQVLVNGLQQITAAK
jgi:hypothetical protein